MKCGEVFQIIQGGNIDWNVDWDGNEFRHIGYCVRIERIVLSKEFRVLFVL